MLPPCGYGIIAAKRLITYLTIYTTTVLSACDIIIHFFKYLVHLEEIYMKIEIEVDNIDYDNLVEQFLPVITDNLRASKNPVALLISNGMPAALAKTVIKGLSREKKDELVAEIINANSEKIKEAATEFTALNKVKLRIKRVVASAD